MKILLSFLNIISFAWSIGLQGLVIPENGNVLSTAGTGVAEGSTPGLNPAMNVSKKSYFQFSLNRWLGDIKGSQTAYHWGQEISQHITIQSWNAKELQLWGDKPDSEPIGTFGVHYVSAAYSISHHLNTPFRFGARIQTNYVHLFTESMSGVSMDVGALFPLVSFITAGLVIRNLGYEYKNNLTATLPMEIGFGTQLTLPFNISVLTDAIYLSEKGTDIRIGVKTHFKWINVHAGTSFNEKRSAQALGFSLNFHKWLINYGIYHHENAILGLPQFLDVRRYL